MFVSKIEIFDHILDDNVPAVTKTDIREQEDGYLLDIELPGFKKEEIKMELEDYQFTKQELKYLELLSEKYPTVQSVCTEIINLKAILNLRGKYPGPYKGSSSAPE